VCVEQRSGLSHSSRQRCASTCRDAPPALARAGQPLFRMSLTLHVPHRGRMHTPGKGMSGSALPYKRTPPSWLKMTANEVRLELAPLLAAAGQAPAASARRARRRLRAAGGPADLLP